MIADRIFQECAGNVHVSDRPFAPETIEKLLRKVTGPSRLNCVGLREPGVWALLSVPQKSTLKSLKYVEITRIQCDERVMGCVESARMLDLMRRHSDVWHKLSFDPTSYLYAPSVCDEN